MKFSELDSGMVVETREGERYLVVKNIKGDVNLMNVDGLSSMHGWDTAELFNESMLSEPHSDFDIMKVFESGIAFEDAKDADICLWERNEVKEMTLAEVSAALGYPVKIID